MYSFTTSSLSEIYYNIRCGLFRSAFDIADSAVKNVDRQDNALLRFWRACTRGLSGFTKEAIGELESLRRTYREIDYAVIAAIIWFHKQAEVIDKQELEKFELMLNVARDSVHQYGAILASDFYLQIHEFEDAWISLHMHIFQQSNDMSEETILEVEKCRLRLWVQILRDDHSVAKADKWVSDVDYLTSKNELNHLDSLMVQARCFEIEGNMTAAIEKCLMKTIKIDSSFFPASIEKAKILLRLRQYDLAEESAQHSLVASKSCETNMEVLRINALVQYVRNNQQHDRITMLKHLVQVAKESTGMNDAKFYSQTACIFSHLCDSNDEETLELTRSLLVLACNVEPDNVQFRLELANNLQRLGKYDDAISEYQLSSNFDDDHIESLQGQVLCLCLRGDLEDARQQMDFLLLMEQDEHNSRGNLYQLHSMLLLNKDSLDEKRNMTTLLDFILKQINEAINKGDLFAIYNSLDVSLVIELSKYYLNCISADCPDVHQSVSMKGISRSNNHHILDLLQLVIEWCPANVIGWGMFVKVLMQRKELQKAIDILDECISVHPDAALVFLLRAQIEVENNECSRAQTSLENAMSISVSIEKHPTFRLVKSLINIANGKHEDASDSLKELLGEKLVQCSSKNYGEEIIFTLHDRISCFIELGTTLMSMKCYDEALRWSDQSLTYVDKSSDQIIRCLKLKSDILVETNNIKEAKSVFECIAEDSPIFITAQMEKANIHLSVDHDKDEYLKCYQRIVQVDQSSQAYLILGDAYMKLQSTAEAMEAYQRASDLNPKDDHLVLKIGKAFSSNHNYQLAIDHLEKKISESNDADENIPSISIYLSLIKLYTTIENFERSLTLINSVRDTIDKDDWDGDQVSTLLQIANFSGRAKDCEKQISLLHEAKEIQSRVLSRSYHGNSKEKLVMVKILRSLARCFQKEGSLLQAGDLYKEALGILKHDETTLELAAKNSFQGQEYEECLRYCDLLLRVNPDHNDIQVVKVDILIIQGQLDEASNFSRTCIDKCETVNWRLLAKYIVVLHWTGNDDKASALLEDLKSKADESSKKADWSFCKGMHFRYTGNQTSAVTELNNARNHFHWSELALVHIIEIYLGVDTIDYWVSAQKELEGKDQLQTVKKLLDELHKKYPDNKKFHTLLAYWQSSASKTIGTSINSFESVLQTNKNYIPALLGLARIHAVNKSESKARNTLKQVVKMTYEAENWNEFEKSHLSLALLYIDRDNMDLAVDLCKQCLFHNKSCYKAYELLGDIFETQSKYGEAIECYKKCWTGKKESMLIGSKLTSILMKSKLFLDALDISVTLMNLCPDQQPMIMSDVVEKCVVSLRA